MQVILSKCALSYNNHRPPPKTDPSICRVVPPSSSFSAPIGQPFGRHLASLVRHIALKPNTELYEEAADKKKRKQHYYRIKNTITNVLVGSQGERLLRYVQTRFRVVLFGYVIEKDLI